MRGFRALQDHWMAREKEKWFRSYQEINYVTAAFGRKTELQPGEVYPILKSIGDAIEESDEDIDPRQSFEMMRHMFTDRKA